MEPFSSLEIQLIKSSLDTRTNEELAELLDRPLQEIIDKINEITGGSAEERSRDVDIYKAELSKIVIQKGRRNIDLAKKDREERRRREKREIANKNESMRVASLKRQDRQRYETREVDLSALHGIRIDSKTYVFVKPGTDEEKIKKQYTRESHTPEYLK